MARGIVDKGAPNLVVTGVERVPQGGSFFKYS
jgi:hypothetical protein